MYIERYKILGKRIGLLMIIYTCCRILFWAFNYKTFSESTLGELLLAFLHGLRFDLSALVLLNTPFILFSILPLQILDTRKAYKLLKTLFLMINLPFLFLNLVDLEYFKFTLKRTGFDIVGIRGDVQNQSLQLLGYYWYIPLLAIALGWMMIKGYGKYKAPIGKQLKVKWAWMLLVPMAGAAVVSIRGGLQLKPIQPDHAFVHTPNVLGNLVLNTPHNFLVTMTRTRIEDVEYFVSDREVRQRLSRKGRPAKALSPGANVVVIILESFSREYMSAGNGYKGYTPFLDSLAGQSTFFDMHFANGRRSIEGIPAIFSSIPSLMDEPYITSPYQSNELHGLAEVLGKHNYVTAFFHAGRNGTMGFDKFTRNSGFQQYYGLNEYPEIDRDFDGTWGTFDEPYFLHVANKLSGIQQPFMASIFTLTSHQPYVIPKQYKGKFPKGTLEIHESIGYTDYALKRFFEQASKTEWYKNTLFIITADHSNQLESERYRTPLGEYNVPLLLYHPGKAIPADTSQVSQHIDIPLTVLDYVGISELEYPMLMGRSLLNDEKGRALFFCNRIYTYVKNDYFLEFDGNSSVLYASGDWSRKQKITNKPDIQREMELEVKAYLQYYSNGLNANTWYRFAEK